MRLSTLPALLLMAAVVFPFTIPLPATASAPVSGGWVRATPPDETRRILDEAVDSAAANVSWMYRGIARPRLARHATACDRYEFTIEDDSFRVTCDSRDPFEWKVGQTGTITGEDGRPSTVELRRNGTVYDLRIESEQGGKAWRYAFDGTGRLVVTQRIFSPHLSDDMEWVLSYAKAR
jgi:hypothetical protein